ncbi:MAG: glucose-6-phosphate isomerase [Bacteroidota bacterium]
MITISLDQARRFIDDTDWQTTFQAAEQSYQELLDRTCTGNQWLGWMDLLETPNDAIVSNIDETAMQIRRDADVMIVCGIGGSYLGAKACIEALRPYFDDAQPEIIFAGHQLSGSYLEQLIAYLEKPREDGEAKSIYLNVISKSGTTLETALTFRILRNWMEKRFPEDVNERIVVTTSREGGALNKVREEKGYRKFVLADDVGGRFSVLTPVGLLPAAVAGLDIQTLYYGAVSAYEAYQNDPTVLLKHATARKALYDQGKQIDLIAAFEPKLRALGGWLQQLLGESEGKQGQGLYPAQATYTTDLHSLGQWVQDGPRNLMETFIDIERPLSSLSIPEDPANTDQLNYTAGKQMDEVNRTALEGTRQAHVAGNVPVITVTLPKLNTQHVGQFIAHFELFTAVYCVMLDVNPFNQPGVEAYKKEIYRLLGRPQG